MIIAFALARRDANVTQVMKSLRLAGGFPQE
jgi:hypothetical protein